MKLKHFPANCKLIPVLIWPDKITVPLYMGKIWSDETLANGLLEGKIFGE